MNKLSDDKMQYLMNLFNVCKPSLRLIDHSFVHQLLLNDFLHSKAITNKLILKSEI